ncbi:MAG: hypothetical protein DRI57_19305 [Deltaproteobacteria bacterium]|nr:MAG: hypothetical protein DRI57_19305 [Deltaproteobacteria bacterium]
MKPAPPQAEFAFKYLAICFQVSAYEEQLFHCEPQMNADERGRPVCRGLIRVHPCSSAVCESCFPRKKSRKTFGWVLTAAVSDKGIVS